MELKEAKHRMVDGELCKACHGRGRTSCSGGDYDTRTLGSEDCRACHGTGMEPREPEPGTDDINQSGKTVGRFCPVCHACVMFKAGGPSDNLWLMCTKCGCRLWWLALPDELAGYEMCLMRKEQK